MRALIVIGGFVFGIAFALIVEAINKSKANRDNSYHQQNNTFNDREKQKRQESRNAERFTQERIRAREQENRRARFKIHAAEIRPAQERCKAERLTETERLRLMQQEELKSFDIIFDDEYHKFMD